MTNYECFHETIQTMVNEGDLTVEEAEIVNDIVFDMVAESGDDCIGDYDSFYDTLTEKVEDGSLTIETAEILNDFMADEVYTTESNDDDESGELLSEAVEYLENLCEEYNID